MEEDDQLSKAIELSMNEAKSKNIALEPLNPEQRVRKSGVPVGLKNIGNSNDVMIKLAISIRYSRLTFKTYLSCVRSSAMRFQRNTLV